MGNLFSMAIDGEVLPHARREPGEGQQLLHLVPVQQERLQVHSLPPEVLETIIKMAINDAMKDNSCWSESHDYLVDVIAEVFPKFKYLAARKSLWRNRICIRVDGAEESHLRVLR